MLMFFFFQINIYHLLQHHTEQKKNRKRKRKILYIKLFYEYHLECVREREEKRER